MTDAAVIGYECAPTPEGEPARMPQSPSQLSDLTFAHGMGWSGVAVLVWFAVVAVVHIAFAIGVGRHAARRKVLFAPAWIWALAALMTGPFGAVAYWVVHVSTLSPPTNDAPKPPR